MRQFCKLSFRLRSCGSTQLRRCILFVRSMRLANKRDEKRTLLRSRFLTTTWELESNCILALNNFLLFFFWLTPSSSLAIAVCGLLFTFLRQRLKSSENRYNEQKMGKCDYRSKWRSDLCSNHRRQWSRQRRSSSQPWIDYLVFDSNVSSISKGRSLERAAAKLTPEFVSLRHLNKSTWLDDEKFNSLAPRLGCYLWRIK